MVNPMLHGITPQQWMSNLGKLHRDQSTKPIYNSTDNRLVRNLSEMRPYTTDKPHAPKISEDDAYPFFYFYKSMGHDI